MAVIDNRERQRFELSADGHVAHADYAIEGDVIVFTHTIVPPALQGRGIGTRLIEGALAQVRERGLKLRADCAFVVAYLAKHPEWQDLQG